MATNENWARAFMSSVDFYVFGVADHETGVRMAPATMGQGQMKANHLNR